LRCKVPLLDRGGRAALAPPSVFVSRPTFTGFINPWGRWVFSISLLLSFMTIKDYGPWLVIGTQVIVWGLILNAFFFVRNRQVDQHRSRTRLIRERVVGAGPVGAIRDAKEKVRIRGRVRIIKPVKGPMGEPVAAYLVRHQRSAIGMISGRAGAYEAVTSVTVEESSACGVFLVTDETGAALIDDDAFAIAPLDGGEVAWDKAMSIIVKEGSEIEVIGPAQRKPSAEYPVLAQTTGYREAPSVLALNGTADERVIVLAQDH
jgi:hypothetical protein